MDITYLGKSSFRIKSRSAVVVIDPFETIEADIVTTSRDHEDFVDLSKVKNYKKALTGPGEYEVMGVSFIGIADTHDKDKDNKNTMFVVEVSGIRICHLGNLNHKLTEEQLKLIGDIDVLMIPVGDGQQLISAKTAVEVTQQVEPFFVIPFGEVMHIEGFLKESGMIVEKDSKFTLKKEDIVADQTAKVISLEIKK